MAPLIVIRSCNRVRHLRSGGRTVREEQQEPAVTISRHRVQRRRNVLNQPETELDTLQENNSLANNNESLASEEPASRLAQWNPFTHDKSTLSCCALDPFDGLRPFRCVMCTNVLADKDDVVSKTFFGRKGKAFLMNCMFNVETGPSKSRYLMTGLHTIADISCAQCHATVGWKYVRAQEASEKYKEGKFIMELAAVESTFEQDEAQDEAIDDRW